MPNIEETIIISARAHMGQKDKAGEPYINHILRVMMNMEKEDEKITALLHDIIEDTQLTIKDLQKLGYKKAIIDAVKLLTKRNINYFTYIKKIKKNEIARKVKIADLQDNLNIIRLPKITEKDYDRISKYLLALKQLNGFND